MELNRFHALGIIKNAKRKSPEELDEIISQIECLFKQSINKSDVISLLGKYLPNFQHIETGLNLDQKM